MKERDPFLLERYKYILSQKQKLNDVTFKIVAVFQAGVALIGSGQFAIIAAFADKKISSQIAWVGSVMLVVMSGMLSVFSLSLLAGGVGGG
ncbi:hypothetical protein [Rhodoplanes roseus]|uniref:hypothetical protein n=1 Tax=Rhodoplanes roseus TaxID=29409 RepID=UPI0011B658A6|nr:hypothetical protein [Rhodoplanes roseus]